MSEQFENIVKYSNEGLLVVNDEGVIETVNPRALAMFGYDDESEVVNQKIELFVPSSMRLDHVALRDSFMQCPANRSLGQGNVLRGEKKNGENFPVKVSLSHYNENGRLKIIVFIVDISKQVSIEKELKILNNELENKVVERTKEINTQNKLLKSIAENFPNGNIYVINNTFEIMWADGKLLRNIGLTDTSLIGVSFIDRLSGRAKKVIGSQLEILFQEKTIKFEIEEKNKHYSIYGVPLSLEEGEVKSALLVEMDITSEKNQERIVKETLNKEKRLNELKSRFVSMASHEFRTPLSTINSSAALIDRYEEDKDKLKRKSHVQRIRKMVSNLTIILNDFLSVEKLESGNASLSITENDLLPMLHQIIEQIQTIKKPNQTINLHFQSGSVLLETDFNVLRNCVFNLLSNAIKYTSDYGEIEVQVTDNKSEVAIQIKDNGIGIPVEDQERIFTRFHRAGNVTNIEGTGLGLNIVKRYLEKLGGNISFVSKVDEGSIFTIRLKKN